MINTNEKVRIDPEFQSLIPPLTPEEYRNLEELCKEDGILDSLKTWRGLLVDGHNRLKISEDWDLNYETEEIDKPNREAVKAWIAKNQLGRRNIDDLTRIKLARIAKPEIEKEAEKRTAEGNARGGSKSPKISSETCDVKRTSQDKRKDETRYKLAKAAGMGEQKFHQGEVILDSGNKKLIEQVQSGEKSINQAYNEIRNKEIKKPPSAKEYRNIVQERHDDFKAQKVTTIEDVKQDKRDKKLLGDEIRRDFQKATDGINNLYTKIIANEIDISLLTEDNKRLAVNALNSAKQKIDIILQKVG